MTLYLWLGPGPERADPPAAPRVATTVREPRETPATAAGAESHTWAEWAWLFVGSYWIVLGLFVIPARLHAFRLGDVLLFGLVPILAALGFRLVAPEATMSRPSLGLDPPGGRLAAGDLAGRLGLPDRRGPGVEIAARLKEDPMVARSGPSGRADSGRPGQAPLPSASGGGRMSSTATWPSGCPSITMGMTSPEW